MGKQKFGEAKSCLQGALKVANIHRRGELNADHVGTAEILVDLANAHLATREIVEARPLLQRAMVIYEENLGEDSPQTKEVREMLAKLNEQMRRAAVSAE